MKAKSALKRIGKILLRFAVFILSLCAIYCVFIDVFFFGIPALSDDSQKTWPYYGYSHPLNLVENADSEYTIVYYTSNNWITKDRYWTVIDDQEAIRKYKDTFVVYINESSIRSGVLRSFLVFENGKSLQHSSLAYFPHCMIFDEFFSQYKQTFTLEEMEQYALEHGLERDQWIC